VHHIQHPHAGHLIVVHLEDHVARRLDAVIEAVAVRPTASNVSSSVILVPGPSEARR
jgi:hypothetical protein